LIDEEVRELVSRAYARTKLLLEERRNDVTTVATLLLEREAIGHADMVRMLGVRPYGDDRNSYDEILADAGRTEVVDGHGDGVKENVQPTGSEVDGTSVSDHGK
jgi:AFG3 family protein